MVYRTLKLLKNQSFFLFGARGTGKTRLLEETFSADEAIFVDLLLPKTFDSIIRDPESLISQIKASSDKKWVILDEVQKAPALLDVVHYAIEKLGVKFALTGSSARKLKRGGANLLAGRALVHYLFPFTFEELGDQFSLNDALQYGLLPQVALMSDGASKKAFLESYIHTYLKEEILIEQVIRSLPPFRKFLEIAAQMNGEIINYSSIASDVGVDDKTVRSYFQILEDTLIGRFIDPYHRSVRKTQIESPKFLFFDEGVVNALADRLFENLSPRTYTYGKVFERFVLNQIIRFNEYRKSGWKFYYLRTQAGAEVDFILERGKKELLLLEVKSKREISKKDLKHIAVFAKDMKAVGYCLSLDPVPKEIEGIRCLPWQEGILEIFSGKSFGFLR